MISVNILIFGDIIVKLMDLMLFFAVMAPSKCEDFVIRNGGIRRKALDVIRHKVAEPNFFIC